MNTEVEMNTVVETTQTLKEKLNNPKRNIAINSKHAIHHIGHKRWDIISKNIGTDFDLWKNLYESHKAINDSTDNATRSQVCCGEEVYLEIRPNLILQKIISAESSSNITVVKAQPKKVKQEKSNSKKLVINKAEKIKLDNLVKKIKIDLDALLKSITLEPVKTDRSVVFNSKFTELALVKMMVQCRNLVLKLEATNKQYSAKSASKYTLSKELTDIKEKIDYYQNELIEVIVGFNKIIAEKKTNNSISQTCLMDLQNWIDYSKKIINFDSKNVIVNMPELIFKTVYDGMLQHKQTGLYQSQKEIFKFVTENQKYLALVHTMLGSGKTSMILPICGWLSSNIKNKTKLIFCCPNEVVLLEVAHMVYGMGVSFAIVIHDQEENKLQYKWSSFADKKNPDETAILYLCDIYVARMLLEERMNCLENKRLFLEANRRDPINYPLVENRIPSVPDYILMGDELTKDADSQNGFMIDSGFSITTEVFVDLMKVAPPKIILMSATLPTAEQLPEFYGSIVNAHPNMVTRSFASSEAKIGCALISSVGELYAPHTGFETIDDIKHVLSVIKTNPFIGRFYTFEVLLLMVETFQQMALPVPDLSVMFDDPSKANQTNIQQTAYKMLEQLIETGSDDIVKKICLMKKNVGNGVDLSTIFTTDIQRFNKGCLIFSADPVTTALEVYQANFNKFLKSKSERNIFQQVRIDTILSKYQREMESFEKAIKRVENKSDDGIIKRNKENDTKERVRTETWQITSNMTDQRPIWDFPQSLQLCSAEHLAKVKCHAVMTGTGGLVSPDDLPSTTNVSMEILTLLASGIGIYSINNPALDDEYLQTVLLLAKKGVIKTIFTDSSIAYGTNLAVSDIIMIDQPVTQDAMITESIIDKHSIKTIFQMLGRAGRGGNLSYEAKIYTISPDNKLIDKIRSYIKGTLDEGSRDEILNIKKAFDVLW